MKQETIIHLETMWMKGLSLRTGSLWTPNTSVSPFLSMICGEWGSNYIYRQIHSLNDLKVWCGSIASSNKTHNKIVWLSGHGGDQRAFRFNTGDDAKEVAVTTIFKAINIAGKLTGLVVDSCSFGLHLEKEKSIPANVDWVLATTKDVDFMGSSFVFAKAVEWITSEKPQDSVKNFLKGISTDYESKKNERVDYRTLVTTMGVRLYCQKKGNFCYYPNKL